jgi:hypothetical protein
MPSNRGKSPTHPFYGICVCGAEMTPLLAFFLHCPKQLLPKDAVILSSPTRRSKLCPRMNPSRIAPLARSSVPHPFACPGSPRIGLHPWGGYWRKGGIPSHSISPFIRSEAQRRRRTSNIGMWEGETQPYAALSSRMIAAPRGSRFTAEARPLWSRRIVAHKLNPSPTVSPPICVGVNGSNARSGSRNPGPE